MDFVSDSLASGRRFRALTIVDCHSRESPWIEVDHSLPGLRVSRVLDRLAEGRGLPEMITVDNGPEFAGKDLDKWAYERGVKRKRSTIDMLTSARQILLGARSKNLLRS